MCLYFLQQFRDAAAAYEKSLSINSKIPSRWINLALCHDALDEHIAAIKAIGQALKLDPANIAFLMLLADLYLKVDNKIKAEQVLERILELQPTSKLARAKLMKLKI